MVFKGQYPCMFEADLGDGEEQELCEGGKDLPVTNDNKDLFANLYLEKYLQKDKAIYQALITGVKATTTKQMLGMLSAKSGPQVAFSNPKINVESLISQLRMDNDDRESKQTFKKF
jgi:hypothetical protein